MGVYRNGKELAFFRNGKRLAGYRNGKVLFHRSGSEIGDWATLSTPLTIEHETGAAWKYVHDNYGGFRPSEFQYRIALRSEDIDTKPWITSGYATIDVPADSRLQLQMTITIETLPGWASMFPFRTASGAGFTSGQLHAYGNPLSCFGWGERTNFTCFFAGESGVKSVKYFRIPSQIQQMTGFFSSCSHLSIPMLLDGIPINCTSKFHTMYKNCPMLTTTVPIVSDKITGSCYGSMYEGCTGLTYCHDIPAFSGFADGFTDAHYPFSSYLKNCTALENPPAIAYNDELSYISTSNFFNSFFYGCTSLKTAPRLVANAVRQSMYSDMFYGCTSLQIAAVSDETLGVYVSNNHSSMYTNCTNLRDGGVIRYHEAAYSDQIFGYTVFNGCVNLQQVCVDIRMNSGALGRKFPINIWGSNPSQVPGVLYTNVEQYDLEAPTVPNEMWTIEPVANYVPLTPI